MREIVANAVDAITNSKSSPISARRRQTKGEYCVKVSVDKDAGTLTVEDNGIGMTEDEVEKYITQIAFSGAGRLFGKV